MEPNMLRDGEKIAAPAGWQAGRDQEAQRRGLLGEWKGYLGAQQAKALDEEGPAAGFRTRLTIDAVKSFTPEEVDELMSAEKSEFERLRPLAVAKSEQLRAHVAAGGSEKEFEEVWAAYGRAATIDATVAANLDRASRSSELY